VHICTVFRTTSVFSINKVLFCVYLQPFRKISADWICVGSCWSRITICWHQRWLSACSDIVQKQAYPALNYILCYL